MRTQRIAVRAGRLFVPAVLATVLLVGGALPALAAKPTGAGGGPGGGGGGGGSVSVPTGNDVSYPQCGSSLPSASAFGIVGVDGGLANDLNPCLGPSASYPSYAQSELYWAVASTDGSTSQPKASLYVNTADPGNVDNGTVVADWPTSGSTPYGSCATTTVALTTTTSVVGANSDACAWQYGYNMAAQDASWLAAAAGAIDGQSPPVAVPATAASYPWWLDVETANTWQTDTTMNAADLQGTLAGLQAAGATTIGAYSTSSQWDTITGGTATSLGSLDGIPVWLPGARSLSGAVSNCAQASFTGGTVTVTQWFSHPVDGDYAC
ncbi:MAG: hypothetical protein M0T71_04510 [Actinomycetota bacterium]|nr:hypothetical protein [Actinomycetota bacterium]